MLENERIKPFILQKKELICSVTSLVKNKKKYHY